MSWIAYQPQGWCDVWDNGDLLRAVPMDTRRY